MIGTRQDVAGETRRARALAAERVPIRQTDDLDAVRKLDSQMFGAEDPRLVTPPGTRAWLAGEDDEPLGYAVTYPLEQEAGRTGCYYARVGVLPANRGQGLARRFLALAVRQARRDGYPWIASDTHSENVTSANVFIRSGWKYYWPAVGGVPGAVYFWKSLE